MITITVEFKANGYTLSETLPPFADHPRHIDVVRLLKRIYKKDTITISDVVITKIVDSSLVIA